MLNPTNPDPGLHKADPDQFARLVEPYRRELGVHCYRMLGSLQDAEEMVQETFLRAWSRRETYAGRASLRAWLYRIATNISIDNLRKKPRRSLPVRRATVSDPGQPIPPAIDEAVWLQPYPGGEAAPEAFAAELHNPETHSPEARYTWRESIRLAFLASLHLLPPYQRAVLILRDVLDWPAAEVAQMLDQTVPSVKSALHRARATLAQHQPGLQGGGLAAEADPALGELLERYVRAWENADVDGLVALLRDDCTFSMPPTPSWYRGRADIAALVGRTIFSGQGRWRLLPTTANGGPGFGLYKLHESGEYYEAYGIQVLEVCGGQIADIVTFREPGLAVRFGLPGRLER